MRKIDFNKEMLSLINDIPENEPLLLHSCCGPCSSSVLEKLAAHFKVTVLYANSNIWPVQEYIRRREEQKRLLEVFPAGNKIGFVEEKYNHDDFLRLAENLKDIPEGGARCAVCFEMRLESAAKYAKENGFTWFASTLSVSPHKNASVLNEIGTRLAKAHGLRYLVADFKKQEGYKRSLELSAKFSMYRQDYCGCEYSYNARIGQGE